MTAIKSNPFWLSRGIPKWDPEIWLAVVTFCHTGQISGWKYENLGTLANGGGIVYRSQK